MRYFVLMLFMLLASCKDKSNEQITLVSPKAVVADNDFFPMYKGGITKQDTISLFARIDDCGEWGGPEYTFKIYTNSIGQYYLDYKRFKFNCDSIPYYRSLKKLPLEKHTVLLLNKKSKAIISDFFTRLMKAKIKENVNSNAGSMYSLTSSDSTLMVNVYSDKDEIKDDFVQFKKKLGLPYTVRKNHKRLNINQ